MGYILDPGFLGTQASSTGTAATRTVEVIAIVLCMVTFTGAIIGYISSMVTSIIDNSEGGPKRMFLKNHIVILNWNNRAAGIISEYLFTDICEDVVVLSNKDRSAINKEIEDSIFELGYNRKQKHVNYVVKQGEPFSYTELDNVCIRQARTVIILSDQDPQDGDLRTLKTVLMVSQMNQGRQECAIVVEADNPNIYELVCRIRENKECNIIPAYLNKLLGKLLAHIALQPKLNVVFAEILSHNGNEFYSIPINKLPGISTESSEAEVIDTYLQNYDHAIPLLTSRHLIGKAMRDYLFCQVIVHTLITKGRRAEFSLSTYLSVSRFPCLLKGLLC